jgi:pyruvate formate lyase activating enzyme
LVVDPHSQPVLDEAELFAFLKKRTGLLDGVAITGGEPTLLRDLPDFVRRVKTMGFAVKLDTNGYRPEVLKAVVEQGLVDYVAMDVKNCPSRYAETDGVENLQISRIEESLVFLLSGQVDYELRTTVVKPLHDRKAMEEICGWLKKLSPQDMVLRIFIQPFVDRDTVIFAGLKAPEKAELLDFQGLLASCAEKVEIRGNS